MLFKLLVDRKRKLGSKIAIVGESKALSFEQLWSTSDRFARQLFHLGVASGDAILIGIPPSVDFYSAFYGACAMGVIVLPVLPSGKVAAVYARQCPVAAIGSDAFLGEIRSRCDSVQHFIRWSSQDGIQLPQPISLSMERRIVRQENILGVSSSGTTGVPSLYLRSAELLVRRAEFRADVLGIGENDVLLSARPFNSGSSINSHVILPLVKGCKIVVHETFQRLQAAQAIAQEKVTVLYSVPFVFELLASIPQSHVTDFSSLRLCISGSAPLSDAVAGRFAERYGVTIRQRYGGSHIHPAFTYNASGCVGAVGQTSGSFPIAILDDVGNPMGPGIVGEIAFDYNKINSEWQVYLKRNPNLRGRYIYTGDLGKYDAEGNVFVVGRKSPFIKVRGNRVEPAEVEAVLRSHPAVTEAFVYAVNQGQPEESVATLLVCNNQLTQAEVIEFCATRMDGYKCPRHVEFVAELPRNEHGKIVRHVLDRAVRARNGA